MRLLLLFGALSAAAVEPEPEAPPPPDTESAAPTNDALPESSGAAPTSTADPVLESSVFADVLARAKRAYFSGKHDVALDLLRGLEIRLLQGEEPNWEHAAEAMVFNGELLLAAGDESTAEVAFRWILERDPDYPLSPYHHPLDVVGTFELVRKAIKAERDAETAGEPEIPIEVYEPRPPPATSYLPFGLPQFTSGRPAAGAVFGVLQMGLGIASVATYSQLDSINTGSALHPLGWSDQQVSERVRSRRFLLQWPLTFAFYGVWVGSHAEARRVWRKQELLKVGVTVTPPGRRYAGDSGWRGCGTVGITGSF